MKPIWKRLAIAAVFVLVIFPIMKFVIAGPDHVIAEAKSNSRLESVGNETRVWVAKESSEGVTNKQVNLEVADAIGDKSLNMIRKHTDRILAAMDSREVSTALRQETELVPTEGINLIVSRIYVTDVNFAIQVAGIQGKDFIRVICTAPRADQNVLLPGKCAKALSEQFNIVLPKGLAR